MNAIKKTYISPEITTIELDNDISLQLASVATPPIGVGEDTPVQLNARTREAASADPYDYEQW